MPVFILLSFNQIKSIELNLLDLPSGFSGPAVKHLSLASSPTSDYDQHSPQCQPLIYRYIVTSVFTLPYRHLSPTLTTDLNHIILE